MVRLLVGRNKKHLAFCAVSAVALPLMFVGGMAAARALFQPSVPVTIGSQIDLSAKIQIAKHSSRSMVIGSPVIAEVEVKAPHILHRRLTTNLIVRLPRVSAVRKIEQKHSRFAPAGIKLGPVNRNVVDESGFDRAALDQVLAGTWHELNNQVRPTAIVVKSLAIRKSIHKLSAPVKTSVHPLLRGSLIALAQAQPRHSSLGYSALLKHFDRESLIKQVQPKIKLHPMLLPKTPPSTVKVKDPKPPEITINVPGKTKTPIVIHPGAKQKQPNYTEAAQIFEMTSHHYNGLPSPADYPVPLSPAVMNKQTTAADMINQAQVNAALLDVSNQKKQQPASQQVASKSILLGYYPTLQHLPPAAPAAHAAAPASTVNSAPKKTQQTDSSNSNKGVSQDALSVSSNGSGAGGQVQATSLIQHVQHEFSGRVTEAFTSAQTPVPGATVEILGTTISTRTDGNGDFYFDGLSVHGVLPVVISEVGFLNRRFDLKKQATAQIEMVAQNSVSLSALASGVTIKSNTGFVFGQLVSESTDSVDAMKVALVGGGASAPIYLNANGAPDRRLKMTSSRGQFLFLNVRPGTYYLTITDAFGNERATHIIYVGAADGLVRKFSMGRKMTIHGKLINAGGDEVQVAGATVKLLGSTRYAVADKSGKFTLGQVYVDCNDLNYLQVDQTGFYRNRIDYACENNPSTVQPIYVFSSRYIDGASDDAQEPLPASTGLVIGHASFKQPVTMQLWGPQETDPNSSNWGKDFYFDTDGRINGSLPHTTKNGNFMIIGAPQGLSYMQSFSKNGRTLSFWPILISPSTVNVYMQ